METQKFARRQFALEAVQVTPTNMNEVARWCGGKVAPADYKMMGGVHKMPEGCVLLPKQGPDGSWMGQSGQERGAGRVYATSLAVLSLAVKFHFLPIYQR